MAIPNTFSYNHIVDTLRGEIDNGRLPQAILFTEREGYGAYDIAISTIQYLYCKDRQNGKPCGICSSCNKIRKLIHPDIHFIYPTAISSKINKDKKPSVDDFLPLWRDFAISNPYFSEHELYEYFGFDNRLSIIGVAEAEEIIKHVNLTSLEGRYKIIFVMFPERMNIEASNKLLKSIEEPDADTYFVFISQNKQKIIPTILSRCRIIEIPPLDIDTLAEQLVEQFNISLQEAKFWAGYAGGSYGVASKLIDSENSDNDNFTVFTDMLNLAASKDLVKLLEVGEQLAASGKEAQKKFCLDALEIIRKLYISSLGLDNISYIPPKEKNASTVLIQKIKKDFYSGCYDLLNTSIDYIDRNVNPKFIFCDFCNKLYYYM